MANVNYQELKKGGFMRQVQKNQFSLRVKVVGGNMKADQLKKVYEIAEKYGNNFVHMTSRQSIEIPFIKLEDVEAVKKELSEVDLQPSACGPRVRTVTACQGSYICSSGLIETSEVARDLDERYFGRELPHKFKFGVTGCRNNCLKAEENDLGIKGGMMPIYTKEACTYCGLCEAVCPTKCIKVNNKEKTLTFNEEECIYCGKCVKGCPTDAWAGKSGFLLYFGGLFGNRIAIGKQLLPIIFSKDELFKVCDVTIDFFEKYGKSKERFRNTVERVGWDLLIKTVKEAIE